MNPSSREAAARERRVDEARFYYWRRMLALEAGAPEASVRESGVKAAAGARFVLVSPKIAPAAERDCAGIELADATPELADAGLELVVGRGWRLRIPCGVDEATLRCVLTALAAQA
jgi:hypothetical protein